MDRKAPLVILFTIFLFAPGLAHAKIEKEDILSHDDFFKWVCIESGQELSATTTTKGATTTEEVCYTWDLEDWVEIKYIGEKSEFAKNEVASQRQSKIQVFDIGNGKIKKRIWLTDQFIRSGKDWYNIEKKQIRKSEFDQINSQFSWINSASADIATSTAGDGYITNKWGAWSTIRDSASGSAVDYTNTSIAIIAKHDTGQGGYRIDAGFLPFDEVPIGGNIESASVFLYTTAITVGDDDPDAFLVIASSSVSDKTQLTTADYNKRIFTALSEEKFLLDIADDSYNEWELNATGISFLATTTFFSVLEGHDYNDNPIQDDKTNQVNFSSSEAGGGSHDPYLEITYIGSSTPPLTTNVRIDEWYCVATTSGNVVETKCEAPILVWLVIAFFAVCVGAMGVLFFKRKT